MNHALQGIYLQFSTRLDLAQNADHLHMQIHKNEITTTLSHVFHMFLNHTGPLPDACPHPMTHTLGAFQGKLSTRCGCVVVLVPASLSFDTSPPHKAAEMSTCTALLLKMLPLDDIAVSKSNLQHLLPR